MVIVPAVIFLGFLELKYMQSMYKYLFITLFIISISIKWNVNYSIVSFIIDSILFGYIAYVKIFRIISEKRTKKNI